MRKLDETVSQNCESGKYCSNYLVPRTKSIFHENYGHTEDKGYNQPRQKPNVLQNFRHEDCANYLTPNNIQTNHVLPTTVSTVHTKPLDLQSKIQHHYHEIAVYREETNKNVQLNCDNQQAHESALPVHVSNPAVISATGNHLIISAIMHGHIFSLRYYLIHYYILYYQLVII